MLEIRKSEEGATTERASTSSDHFLAVYLSALPLTEPVPYCLTLDSTDPIAVENNNDIKAAETLTGSGCCFTVCLPAASFSKPVPQRPTRGCTDPITVENSNGIEGATVSAWSSSSYSI